MTLLREVAELRAAVTDLAGARRAHAVGKSDPERSVGTGLALYAAERSFSEFADALEAFPGELPVGEDRGHD